MKVVYRGKIINIILKDESCLEGKDGPITEKFIETFARIFEGAIELDPPVQVSIALGFFGLISDLESKFRT